MSEFIEFIKCLLAPGHFERKIVAEMVEEEDRNGFVAAGYRFAKREMKNGNFQFAHFSMQIARRCFPDHVSNKIKKRFLESFVAYLACDYKCSIEMLQANLTLSPTSRNTIELLTWIWATCHEWRVRRRLKKWVRQLPVPEMPRVGHNHASLFTFESKCAYEARNGRSELAREVLKAICDHWTHYGQYPCEQQLIHCVRSGRPVLFKEPHIHSLGMRTYGETTK